METLHRINFKKVGEIDAELTLAATLEDDMALADAFAKNCKELFGIKYNVKTAEHLLVFRQAIEAHRKEDWQTVENNLVKFYQFISENSPILAGFDPEKAALHQKKVWQFADNSGMDSQEKMLKIRHEWRGYLMTIFQQTEGVVFSNAAIHKADSVIAQKQIDHNQNPVLRQILKKYYSFLITRNIKQSWEAVEKDLNGESQVRGVIQRKT